MLSRKAWFYIGFVTLLTLGVLLDYWIYNLHYLNSEIVLAFIILGVLVFLSEIYEIELPYRRRMSTAIAVIAASVLLGGPTLAIILTATATLLAEILLRWDRLKEGLAQFVAPVLFNTGQLTLAAYAATWTFRALGGQPLLLNPSVVTGDMAVLYLQVFSALAAFVVLAFVNNSLVSGIITLTQGTSFLYHIRFNLHHLLAEILSLGVLGVLMALLYAWSPWNLALILIPLGLVHISLRNYMKLRHEAQRAFEQIVLTLSARDPYTYEHSKQVAETAEKIARKLRLPEDLIEKIRSAAMIHDIGKIGIPDEILQKPGPLTEQEWAIMKKHPNIGADLIKGLEIYTDIADIVRYEHERWNGSGYPKGLKGEEIPLGARIVAAADIWNALITDRPYRPAYSYEEAVRLIREMRGKELDPKVADALLSVVEGQKPQAQTKMELTASSKSKNSNSASLPSS